MVGRSDTGMQEAFFVDFVIGLLFVVAFARAAFDRPYSVRSYTTAAWYYFGLILYVAIRVLMYYLLVLPLPVTSWASPVAVALGIILLHRIPLLSRLDQWLRRPLRRLTGWPRKAIGFAEALSKADVNVSPGLAAEVKSLLVRRGYYADEEWLPAAEPMRRLWFKSAALFHQVRGWEGDRRYRWFVEGHQSEFDVLRGRFDELSLKIVRVLAIVEDIGDLAGRLEPERSSAGPPQKAARSITAIVDAILANLREDIAFFHKNLCLYVARGVLAGAVTAGGRRRRLKELGVEMEPPLGSIPLALGSAFASYVAVFGVFWLPAALRAPAFGVVPDREVGDVLLLMIMIATIQVAALAATILAKKFFWFANEDIRGRTPFGFVIGSGAATMVLGVPIQLFFIWLMNDADLERAKSEFASSWPWLFTALATGSGCAWLIQDSRWLFVPWRWVRGVLDGTVMVVGMSVATYLALSLGAPSRLGSVWPIVMLIGLVGGLVASTRRRRAAERLAEVARGRAPVSKPPLDPPSVVGTASP
jgi:hypothetical protein